MPQDYLDYVDHEVAEMNDVYFQAELEADCLISGEEQ